MLFDDKDFWEEDKNAQDFIFSGISVEIIKEIRVNVQKDKNAESNIVAAELKDFEKLFDENNQQNLEKLVENLCTFNPKTFGGYLALLQTFSVLVILKNPSISFSLKIAQLKGHICGIPSDEWIEEPIKVRNKLRFFILKNLIHFSVP